MADTHAKVTQGQRSLGSKVRVETDGRTDGQTDGATALLSVQNVVGNKSTTNRRQIAVVEFEPYAVTQTELRALDSNISLSVF